MGDIGQKVVLSLLGAGYLVSHVGKALGQARYLIIAPGVNGLPIVSLSDLCGCLGHTSDRAGDRVPQDKGNDHRQQHDDRTDEQQGREHLSPRRIDLTYSEGYCQVSPLRLALLRFRQGSINEIILLSVLKGVPVYIGRNAQTSGARLWQRISEEADYKSYVELPGHEGVRPGQSPHGRFHVVYINKVLAEALPVADRRAPVGTIIVKENLTAERELDALTVLAKVDGYAPEHNDWFWAKFAPDGAVQAEGSPAGCVRCHEGMVHNDYVIIRRLDE